MQFITELLNRIRSESPRFFIVLRWGFGALGVLALVLRWVISAKIWYPIYAEAVIQLCVQVLFTAAGVWGTSFLPVTDKQKFTDPRDPPPPKP